MWPAISVTIHLPAHSPTFWRVARAGGALTNARHQRQETKAQEKSPGTKDTQSQTTLRYQHQEINGRILPSKSKYQRRSKSAQNGPQRFGKRRAPSETLSDMTRSPTCIPKACKTLCRLFFKALGRCFTYSWDPCTPKALISPTFSSSQVQRSR